LIRALFVITLLLVLVPTAVFSMGALHLFADTTSLDISADIAEYGTQNIWIVYAPSDEEITQCISGLEFMVHWDATHLVESGQPVFNDIVHSTMGQIRTGITILLYRELWISEGHFFLGYFPVLGLQAITAGSEPVILSVVADPRNLYDAPIVADCLTYHYVHAVQGGKFVFPYEARVVAVESKSWGAIKTLLN
jgi:hypothetical protein